MTDLATIDYTNNDIVIREVDVNDKEGRLTARKTIEQFEDALQDLLGSEHGNMDEINNEGLHEYFIEDAYIRELYIPKDTAMVSRLWTKERFWIIAKGEVTFTTEMGIQRVKAPYTKIVPPGSKVALYTHEDTLWYAIVGTDATNHEEAKMKVTADDYTDCTYPWDILGGGK